MGSTALPKSIFDQLIENVYELETVTIEVDGKEEIFYSQAIPSDTDGDRSKIQVYMIFMYPSNFNSDSIEDVEESGTLAFLYICAIIGAAFGCTLSIILFIGYKTSRRIISAIAVMTNFTNQLKYATDLK